MRFLRIYFMFIVILNVPSWAQVSQDNFHFYALYIDEIIKIYLIWFDLMNSFCEIHISVSQMTTHHYSEDGLNWHVAGTDLGIHRCWHLQAWSDSCRNERGGIPAFHTLYPPSLDWGSLCSQKCCQSERRNPSHCNRSLKAQSEPAMTPSDENPKALPDTNLKSEASHMADSLSRFSLEDWSAEGLGSLLVINLKSETSYITDTLSRLCPEKSEVLRSPRH